MLQIRIGGWGRWAALLGVLATLQASCGLPSAGCAGTAGAACLQDQPAPKNCTVLTVSAGDQVFFGGNSDWHNDDNAYYWVDPGGPTGYGAVYIGPPHNVQQGFNELGLAYDSNGLPLAPVSARPGREPVSATYAGYVIEILRACATVEEVIAWVDRHQWHTAMHDQLHFADAGGDAVVISAGPDGEIALTRKPPGDGFLVSTNFNLANPTNGTHPCWRHARAEAQLAEMESSADLTPERVASVLDATHVATPNGWTVWSVLGDLSRGLVHVYLFHQFDAPITLNVAEEIARAPAPGPLRGLFPPSTLAQVDAAYHQMMVARPTQCGAVGLGWLGLVVVTIPAFLLLAKPSRRTAPLWMPIVTVLGPLGLLAWLTGGRFPRTATKGDERSTRRRQALVETAATLVPAVIGVVLAFLVIVRVPAIGDSSLGQLAADWGLPLGLGLLFVQVPLLARAGSAGLARRVRHYLPWAVVSANLAIAGLLAVVLFLVPLQVDQCPIDGTAPLSWWAVAAVSVPLAGLPLYTYQRWAIPRNLALWSALLRDEERPSDRPPGGRASWRQAVAWLLTSLVAVVAGIAVGAILNGFRQALG